MAPSTIESKVVGPAGSSAPPIEAVRPARSGATVSWVSFMLPTSRPASPIPSQSYFWTPEWQAAEREADQDLRCGHTRRFDRVDDALDWLEGKQD